MQYVRYIFHLHGIQAVSYTHLDVYKRQICNKSEDNQHVRHGGDKRMHLKLRGKETGNRRKHGAQKDAHNQCQHDSRGNRQGGKVKDMTEHSAGVDALVHDDGRSGHTHTNHTSYGQVGTSQHDEAGNAQRQEHSRGRLLKNVEHVVVGQQRHILDDRRDRAQDNTYNNNGNIQSVVEEELSGIEFIFVILPSLRSRLHDCLLSTSQMPHLLLIHTLVDLHHAVYAPVSYTHLACIPFVNHPSLKIKDS